MLEQCDSYELTEWLAFFEAKHERDEQAREEAERNAKFQKWLNEV